MSDTQKQLDHNFVDGRCTKCGQTQPDTRNFTFTDRLFGRSITCPSPEDQEAMKVYEDAIAQSQKQLGEDWTEDTPLAQILSEINKAMENRWESQGYTRKVTITIPATQIQMLMDRKAFTPAFAKDHPIAKMTCWDYIRLNNLLASTGMEWEILPRHSFKDVISDALALFNPQTAIGEDLDRLNDLIKLPAIERGRRNEGDPDAVPDPNLGGFMESDAALRKRVLAAHREKFPQPAESKGSILRRLHDQAVVGNSVTIDGEKWVKVEDGIERVSTRADTDFLAAELERASDLKPLGTIGPSQPPPPRPPTPPGPKRYEMNYDRMTCFDGEAEDAPDEVTEWISAQDYEADIAEKGAEIKGLEIQIGKLIVPPHEFRPFGAKKIWCDICGQREGAKTHAQKEDESHGQECQLRYEKTPGYGCTCKKQEGK